MSWLDKISGSQLLTKGVRKRNVPEGLWTKCGSCQSMLYRAELERTLEVCPKCSAHHPIGSRARLNHFLDEQNREELAKDVSPLDPLKFKDSRKYTERLKEAQSDTDERDALVVMRGEVMGLPLVVNAFEFGFMGGSMGSVVGEKFVRGANASLEHGVPLVCFAASGGARMQESLFSLMQMAKTSAALAKLHERGLPFISVITHPPWAAYPPASQCWAISTSQSPGHWSGLPVLASSNRPYARSCQKASSALNSCSNTALWT